MKSNLQTALRMVMEPIFEQDFATHSYGFRPNRGCKDALRRVQERLDAGRVHIVDADLKSYFYTRCCGVLDRTIEPGDDTPRFWASSANENARQRQSDG